jgi:alcohol dehydrogenase class IV
MTYSFDMLCPTRIAFGCGKAQEAPEEVRRLGASRPLVVTGPTLGKSAMAAEFLAALEKAGIPGELFTDAEPEPPAALVEEAGREVRNEGFDLLIGLGGGSTMDFTKGLSVCAATEQPLREFVGQGLVPAKGLPMIMIPTTAGSGSEVSPVAVFSFPDEGVKLGLSSPFLTPDAALVDPLLTVGLPPTTTAYTGMDALIHGLESYLSRRSNAMSELFSLSAVAEILPWLEKAVKNGSDIEARTHLSLGSLLAGLAFSMAGTAAIHALAYPPGGTFHVPHGLANTVLMKSVLQFTLPWCGKKTEGLARALGVDGADDAERAEEIFDRLQRLVEALGCDIRLRELAIAEEDLPKMAKACLKEARLLANNPRPVTESDALAIYRRAW